MTIAVDMDDTIENLLEYWLCKLNEKSGHEYTINDITTWDIEPYFPELTTTELVSVIEEDDFWKDVTPKDDAIRYIKKLIEERNSVYIVTSSNYKGLTSKMENCLFKWFPYLTWDNVIVTSHKELISCDVIIDDNEWNVKNSLAELKIVYDTPHSHVWNFSDVHYISTWEEIYELIANYKK